MKKIDQIKKNIEGAYDYFRENYESFNRYRNLVFDTSIEENERQTLETLERPIIEFNSLEAHVSGLIGQFVMHEPKISISSQEGFEIDPNTIKLIENHIRYRFQEASKQAMGRQVYTEMASGGFSAAKVYTDFAGEMSFKQVIKAGKTFDPTLMVWDPMARDVTKKDGKFSGEITAVRLEELKASHPNLKIEDDSYSANFGNFKWSYSNNSNEKFVLVVDYYEKHTKRTEIVELADGQVMKKSDHKLMLENWDEIPQAPIQVGKPRWTVVTTIWWYKVVENQILETKETDYRYLPHVFFDCNSALLEKNEGSGKYQKTRPYVYNAIGIQKMKNVAGMTACNHMQNLTQSKYHILEEAIPDQEAWITALTDPQTANLLVTKGFKEDDPDYPIQNGFTQLQPDQLPQDILITFNGSDQNMQSILGGFGSNLNTDDKNLSGKAVIEVTTKGNQTAMPMMDNYLKSLEQMANIMVDLMPKYIVGKRNLPIIGQNRNEENVPINQPGHPTLDYDSNSLRVKIEAGLSFDAQKAQAMMQLTGLMRESEKFREFMGSPEGFRMLLDNLTLHGVDHLKEAVEKWFEEQPQKEQQALQQQQQAMKDDPSHIMAEAQMLKAHTDAAEKNAFIGKMHTDESIDMVKVEIDKSDQQRKNIETMAKIGQLDATNATKQMEAEAKVIAHRLDLAAETERVEHLKEKEGVQELRETVKLISELNRDEKENKNDNK